MVVVDGAVAGRLARPALDAHILDVGDDAPSAAKGVRAELVKQRPSIMCTANRPLSGEASQNPPQICQKSTIMFAADGAAAGRVARPAVDAHLRWKI